MIRGGSWGDVARFVRAAYRYRHEPSYRDDYLGFRCAEFRAPGPVGQEEQEAERARERGGVGAEHPETATKRAERAGSISMRPECDGVSVRDACAGAGELGRRARSCSAR